MAFYCINRENIVQTYGHDTEMGAKREALQRLGRLSFETAANMNDQTVETLIRSMASKGVRVLWSDRQQTRGKPYMAAS